VLYIIIFINKLQIKKILFLIIITNSLIINKSFADSNNIFYINDLQKIESNFSENKYLESYNRIIHSFNQWLFSLFISHDNVKENINNIIPNSIKTATTNFMSNLINEPLTIAASIVSGDKVNALSSTTRFIINTTVGFGGFIDIANYIGYSPNYRDLGLAMCKYGVPPGPHIVVPLVGPRTLRDGAADVFLVNALYLTLLASLFGTSFNTGVIIGVILMETIGDLVLVRQIDSPEINEMNLSYEMVRDNYLNLRESKCKKN